MKENIRVIQSIQRAIDIINCFNENKPCLSINDISNELSLHINTTRGIVNTLVYNGYLVHDPVENKYSLGLVFIPKADLVNIRYVDRIKELVRPHITYIANKYQVSGRLQLVSKHHIYTVDTVNPENSRYLLLTRLDTPFPLNATSSGKLYLYYLESKAKENFFNNIDSKKYTEKTITEKVELEKEMEFIKTNGYSLEDEESSIGISSIAVPLLNKQNELKGTISITAMNSIIETVSDKVIVDMKDAAIQINKYL